MFRLTTSLAGCRYRQARLLVHPMTSTVRCTSSSTRKVWDFPASDGAEEKQRGTLYQSDNGQTWNIVTRKPTSTENQETSFAKFQDYGEKAVSHLLPAHYPQSVAPGYLPFASYCFTASIAGSAAMVLSTQTLLLAVGVVGQSGQQAGIMAGALNWVMKDFVGQLGGVLFASQMGQTRAFDNDPKRWRMVSAMALDGATLLEILSPLFPTSLVLPVASFANVGKNIGFLTASASRAALHQSLAITGNLGDVTAKSGSQTVMAGLIGTSIGIALSSWLAHDTLNYAMGFAVLTVLHQGCHYMSLRSVPLAYFNRQRLNLLLDHYIQTSEVLNPAQVARRESYFPLIQGDSSLSWLVIGSPLTTICPVPSELDSMLQAAPDEHFLARATTTESGNTKIHLVFSKDARGEDLIRGMWHAYLLHQSTEQGATDDTTSKTVSTTIEENFPSLLEQLHKAGWQTGTTVTNVEHHDAHRFSIDQ